MCRYPRRPATRASAPGWRAAWGHGVVLPLLLEEEGKEVKSYLTCSTARRRTGSRRRRRSRWPGSRRSTPSGWRRWTARAAEPWHKTGAGGFLRNIVYGFNDGLTANFGLVAGMLGAQASQPRRAMRCWWPGWPAWWPMRSRWGRAGYLAAKSEREVIEHEIAMEREEIRLMPELEQEELSLMYQAKGIPAAQADELAAEVMEDPEALAEKVREELGISDPTSSPMREAWLTGTATALGAFIPVAPFLFGTGRWAIWTRFALAMLSHFAVGAARSFFTGRGVVRSGMDMFVVGLGVAVVGYFVGDWIVRLL